MDATKKILNISLALGFVLCSLSLFIFSLKSFTANAKPRNGKQGDYEVAGIISSGINSWEILGYNPVNGDVKVVGKYKH